MIRLACALGASMLLLMAIILASPEQAIAEGGYPLVATQPPAVADVMQSGVLIVVSKASQRMFVFKDGQPWQTSPVSTGRRGHSTPAGVFPILQKAVRHRSNLYSNAPMPYMQRLTWRGVAIHAGHLPGYPASHGCIRLPLAFARALYGLTRASTTTVVVTNEPVFSHMDAGTLALNTPVPQPAVPFRTPVRPQLAQAQVPAPVPAPVYAPPPRAVGPTQTIQLAAAVSPAEADAHWASLISQHPALGDFEKQVVPAIVGSRRFYRLRASAPDAFAFCSSLRRAGEDCFNVG
ncbi:L,D-transpeptidase family protein [Novosphingobium colocasiae]|uniref:L,D-TPase catalytic domain-containing protein n=1 Tax=Novosphingobium colocasiae TaxID=1256513 RepID=A0A918UER0_9SPHN|nr:L,D-transpeptidase family protein [Novosphingobium colocasiae]GGY97528.1 hypothetical protein GCM10011614_10700 [Novosphingobium colocasiae]